MNPQAASAQPAKIDRYVTFAGMDCDERAEHLMMQIHQRLRELGAQSPWSGYFTTKLAEAEHRGHDALFFVGSQVNALRELFAAIPDAAACDAAAMELLEALEEECC
jgi:hypothetical protein